MAFVRLERDRKDLGPFRNHDVIIDGARYHCVDARTYAPGPYRIGDTIGLLVADVQPSISRSH